MKRLLRLLFALILIAGCWYFLIKDHQQTVNFNSGFPSGVLYDHLTQWANVLPDGIDSVRTTKRNPYTDIDQLIYIQEEQIEVKWEIESTTDSTSRLHAHFDKTQNDFSERIAILLGQSDLPAQGLSITKHVRNTLTAKAKGFRVGQIADTLVPQKYVAYISVESTVRTKARDMIYRITDIMGYIKQNGIELDGDPFLQLTSWDRSTDRISFDFNFPIVRTDSLPPSPIVKFKQVPQLEALHVPFYGNYRISDIGWYQLLAHAQNKGIETQGLPVEIFRNDPHLGGNELEWRADILLPLGVEN